MTDFNIKDSNILIVDDKESNIQILEGLLEDSGFVNFRSTTDPRQVMSTFRTFKPDLILLDLMMPHMNGFEVMDLLKAEIPPGTYLPILVLTADITPAAKRKALADGAKDFLSKPFDLYEVRLRISNLLETRYLHLQLQNQNQILEEKVKERTHDLEQANLTLDIALKELEVLDNAKREFLGMISHEIRTPLNGVLGFAGVLKNEISSPELLEYLQFLEISAQRLERFSYQALLITELRAKSRGLRVENVKISKLFGLTNQVHQEKMITKNMKLILVKEHPVEHITGDAELLQICFDQIVDNSIKYSNAFNDVIVKVSSQDQHTILDFIDAGKGFTAETLQKPFRIFGLGERHTDRNTGLNLALIKLIMDAHSGQIGIFNNEMNGATVRLTFRI